MHAVKKLKNFFWNAEIFPQVIYNAMVATQQSVQTAWVRTAFFGFFLASSFFLLPNIVHAHTAAGNANR